MFIDYYEVLNISCNASFDEIKIAYRHESVRWHPDKNRNIDTTLQMQRINEAYAILKDYDKRKRYDDEYIKFKEVMSHELNKNEEYKDNRNIHQSETWEYNYEIKDDILKEDIVKAKKYAAKLVKEFMYSLKSCSKDAVNGAWSWMKPFVVWFLFIVFLNLILYILI